MTNREQNALALKDCTGLATYGGGEPMAVIRAGEGDYRDPRGLKVRPPNVYVPATLEEILDAYDSQGLSVL